jgi:uncharacterized protein YbaR (Trm112 family)
MHITTLDILRCPYCGGRLELVVSLFHRREGDEIQDGILGCHCCIFAVVDGIPVMHLDDDSTAARDHVQAGRPDLARRTMFGLGAAAHATLFDEAASSDTATYRDVVEALGPTFEGGYFLYRFSDPTYIVADAVVRAVAGTVLKNGGRAVDLCGGSGHLTRSLLKLSSPPPVLADLYFSKTWLARRFTSPGCEAVCCDGNSPLPFRRGAFHYAMCTDAFMFLWTKRLFVGEMARLIDDGRDDGAILIGHTHNERVWSPSHGQPLSQEGYRDLFETLEPRIFGEAALFADVVKGGPLDLGRREPADVIDADPALTIVASRHPDVFKQHRLDDPRPLEGEYRLNPLYAVERTAEGATLRLKFPDDAYEEEYGASREYLPDEVTLKATSLSALADGRITPELAELARRRVILQLPAKYC